jgi:DNA-binding Xre family transcriptional regulator
MITYKPLWETMGRKGVTQYYLRTYCDIHSSTLKKLKLNKPVNTVTIERLCEVLDCDVQDVMRYEKK